MSIPNSCEKEKDGYILEFVKFRDDILKCGKEMRRKYRGKRPRSFIKSLKGDCFDPVISKTEIIVEEVMEKENGKKIIRFCVTGDTHGYHSRLNYKNVRDFKVQEGEFVEKCVLIHTGDFTDWEHWEDWNDEFKYKNKEVPQKVHQFREDMMKEEEFDRVVMVSGNNDCGFEDVRGEAGIYDLPFRKKLLEGSSVDGKIKYLNNESCTIDGLKLYGFAFSGRKYSDSPSDQGKCPYPIFETKKEIVNRFLRQVVPEDPDILILHYPPCITEVKEYIDLGDEFFRIFKEKMKRLKVICFGHIHSFQYAKKLGGIWFISSPAFNTKEMKIGKLTCFDLYV